MDTKEVHPADAFGKRNGPATVPMRKILEAVDAELARPPVGSVAEREDKEAYLKATAPPNRLRADNRLEEISRLLLSLPFGEMLKLAEEIVQAAPALEEGKPELPAHIQMAMSLDGWAKDKMEERDGSVRETPTSK